MAKRGKTGPKSARKGSRKQPKQRAAAAPEPTDSERECISASKLQSLLKQERGLAGQMNSLGGSRRELISNAVQKDHLNKRVYAIIKKWDRLEPEELALDWDTLIEYWERSGLRERAELVISMDLQPAEAGEEVVEEEGPPTTIQPAEDDDKITRITDNVSTPRFGGVAH